MVYPCISISRSGDAKPIPRDDYAASFYCFNYGKQKFLVSIVLLEEDVAGHGNSVKATYIGGFLISHWGLCSAKSGDTFLPIMRVRVRMLR